MNTDQALEMARCVQINIENMAKMMPALPTHPLLVIVLTQIAEVITELDGDGT